MDENACVIERERQKKWREKNEQGDKDKERDAEREREREIRNDGQEKNEKTIRSVQHIYFREKYMKYKL